ncbi:MAG TPA: GGDEF domain-containing protein [Mycobacteriales bacterium]|nr:GGDEF domain-containing protein [Mycobacteriales bacterium]
MEITNPTGVGAGPDGRTLPAEAEVVRLRAEVARLRAERAALWWATGHDELTGLPNRRLFSTLARSLLDPATRAAVVIVLDLNGFKTINDTFGHAVGDRVLRIVAGRLAARAGDQPVARLGGDEFAAVLTGPERPPARDWWWRPIIGALSTVIAEPIPTAGRLLAVTASIGIAPVHTPAPIDELLHRADLAMYRAKAAGRPDALCPNSTGVDADRLPAGIGAPPRSVATGVGRLDTVASLGG